MTVGLKYRRRNPASHLGTDAPRYPIANGSPQIKKIEIKDRSSRKSVVRYEVRVIAGLDPESGRRRQVRRRYTTEATARAELAALQAGVAAGTYVHASRLTIGQACDSWLLSKHGLKPSTVAGHRVSLGRIQSELGNMEVQKLTKAHLDGLVGRLRHGFASLTRGHIDQVPA